MCGNAKKNPLFFSKRPKKAVFRLFLSCFWTTSKTKSAKESSVTRRIFIFFHFCKKNRTLLVNREYVVFFFRAVKAVLGVEKWILKLLVVGGVYDPLILYTGRDSSKKSFFGSNFCYNRPIEISFKEKNGVFLSYFWLNMSPIGSGVGELESMQNSRVFGPTFDQFGGVFEGQKPLSVHVTALKHAQKRG